MCLLLDYAGLVCFRHRHRRLCLYLCHCHLYRQYFHLSNDPLDNRMGADCLIAASIAVSPNSPQSPDEAAHNAASLDYSELCFLLREIETWRSK